jgi:hypothetical protein
MNFNKLLYVLLLFAGLLVLSVQQWGCNKEFSYEGGDTTAITDTTVITDTTSQNDSVPTPEPIIYCPLCHEDSMALGSWNFKNNQSYFCGTTTDAGFISNATFTFFGPSACSVDSGIVITAYMPVPFDEDKVNITTNRVAFYYYNHKGNKDMFIKLPPLPFSLTVNSYSKSTGITTGTFQGTVYKENGDSTHITNGRFMVKLH